MFVTYLEDIKKKPKICTYNNDVRLLKKTMDRLLHAIH
jgi:hypothetical protein